MMLKLNYWLLCISHNGGGMKSLGNSELPYYQDTKTFDARTEALTNTSPPMFYYRVCVPGMSMCTHHRKFMKSVKNTNFRSKTVVRCIKYSRGCKSLMRQGYDWKY